MIEEISDQVPLENAHQIEKGGRSTWPLSSEDRGLGRVTHLSLRNKTKAGRMPATVPFDGPKKWANESPREKEGPNSKTGGMGYGATGSLQKGDGPDTWAQDVRKAHDAPRNDDTSTTARTRRLQKNRSYELSVFVF